MEFVLAENKIGYRFFNAQKQLIDPDIDRVSTRIKRLRPKAESFVTVAIPYEGVKGLRAPKYMQKPKIFQMNLSLMRDGSDEAVEFFFPAIRTLWKLLSP